MTMLAFAGVLTAAPSARADELVAPVTPLVVVGRSLEDAIRRLEDPAAAAVQVIERNDILTAPGGQTRRLAQVLQFSASVSPDAVGEVSVRGQVGAVQYRIDGVALPDGAASFGRLLNGRFADRIDVYSGALPARYGRAGQGVVQITPRSPPYEPGGAVEIYGGGEDAAAAGLELTGDDHGTDIFFAVDGVADERGVDGPTPAARPLHDRTVEGRAFTYLSRSLSDNQRLNLFAGLVRQNIQAPTVSGRQPGLGFVVQGVSTFPSAKIEDRQTEETHFVVASWLLSSGRLDLQSSVAWLGDRFGYRPQELADLLYTGLAQHVRKTDDSASLRFDGVWRLNKTHSLGFGVDAKNDILGIDTLSKVLAVSGSGAVGHTPLTIRGRLRKSAFTDGAYLQEDWKPVETLSFNLGVRWDQAAAYVRKSQFSPSASAVYQPLTGLRFRLAYSHVFTPPPLQRIEPKALAIFYNTTATSFSLLDHTPLPEEADEADAGVDIAATSSLSLSLNAYVRTAENMLDAGQFAKPIIDIPFNYARGKQSGADIRAVWRIGSWQAFADLRVNRALGRDIITSQSNFSAATLSYVARHWVRLDHDQALSGVFGLDWRRDQTAVSLSGHFGTGLRATVRHPNDSTLADQATVDVSATHGFDLPGALGPLDLRIDVFNLFDQVNKLRDGTSLTLGGAQYGPRREVYVGLVRSF